MESKFIISSPINNQERKNIQLFFNSRIPDIAHDAVPMEEWDYAAKSNILQAKDSSGTLVGAASAGVPFSLWLAKTSPEPMRRMFSAHLKHASQIRELDLIAVDQSVRNAGIASQLLQKIEQKYKSQGVKYFIGNVADEENEAMLKNFYTNRGFKITKTLPHFFGLNWVPSFQQHPTFYFHKKLGK